jgi:sec-independent protein translocase protein TatC
MDPSQQPEQPIKQMSFFDHLEELRWHILRALISIIVCMIVLFAFMGELIRYVILGPLSPDFITNRVLCQIRPSFCLQALKVSFQATAPTEQFSRAILIAVVGGFILSFPYIIWELWRFIRPGLYDTEVKRTRGIVGIISVLFFIGVGFTYFFILPVTFRFLAEFSLDPRIQNNWRIGDVVGLIVQFCVAGGLIFEQPVLVYFLAQLGMLSPMVMRKYRRHAIIITLVVAGILTPSPDIMSQLLLGLPMIGLYEVSIYVCARVYRQRQMA